MVRQPVLRERRMTKMQCQYRDGVLTRKPSPESETPRTPLVEYRRRAPRFTDKGDVLDTASETFLRQRATTPGSRCGDQLALTLRHGPWHRDPYAAACTSLLVEAQPDDNKQMHEEQATHAYRALSSSPSLDGNKPVSCQAQAAVCALPAAQRSTAQHSPKLPRNTCHEHEKATASITARLSAVPILPSAQCALPFAQ